MNNKQKRIVQNVDTNKQLIYDAERFLWAHPQTGYMEWEAHNYLEKHYRALGYEVICAGDIPGFYTDIDTGIPGPKLCFMGELDALDVAGHPEAVNGAAHCCGHHAQSAALLGVAAALKEPGALDGLCGSIRLMAVPAEEMIQLNYREQLRKDGVIRYYGGKQEFLARGYFDGVDMAILVHGGWLDPEHPLDFTCGYGQNGCISKIITYKGKASHAGGSPHMGINAQYAAMLGLQACNDLRETFREVDTIRFHPIMKGVETAVNVIPDEMKIETYVRGKTIEAIKRENVKINRALTGAALAMGAGVEISDRPGYCPRNHDMTFMRAVEQACADLVGAENISFRYDSWGTASSDAGDVSVVMPCMELSACGYGGTGHGIDFHVVDVDRLCVNSAKIQLFVAEALLGDGAAKAKEILAGFTPLYPSVEAYCEAMDELIMDKDCVQYDERGGAIVDYLRDKE